LTVHFPVLSQEMSPADQSARLIHLYVGLSRIWHVAAYLQCELSEFEVTSSSEFVFSCEFIVFKVPTVAALRSSVLGETRLGVFR
jgi:hypothetical protein